MTSRSMTSRETSRGMTMPINNIPKATPMDFQSYDYNQQQPYQRNGYHRQKSHTEEAWRSQQLQRSGYEEAKPWHSGQHHHQQQQQQKQQQQQQQQKHQQHLKDPGNLPLPNNHTMIDKGFSGKGKISRKILQIATAEFLGTATLVYVGIMGCATQYQFGLALILSVHTFGHISGAHYNPAVTVGAAIMGVIHWHLIPVYIVSQFLGSFLAYGFYYLTVLIEDATPDFCTTTIKGPTTVWQGFGIEVIGTFMLVIWCCSAWDEKNPANNGANCLKLGFGLMGLIYASAPRTGASFNIARTFPGTVLEGNWENHWVYWTAPFIGGILASSLYRFVLKDRSWQEET